MDYTDALRPFPMPRTQRNERPSSSASRPLSPLAASQTLKRRKEYYVTKFPTADYSEEKDATPPTEQE
jgi:hypothetical protein